MAYYKTFEELSIWQISRELCKDIYRITNYDQFSKDLRFASQIRAASGSIMDNIAENEHQNLVKKNEDLSNSILLFIDYLKRSPLSGTKFK